jgi:hypothetical protein
MRKLRRATLVLAVAADLILLQTGCVIDITNEGTVDVASNDFEASVEFETSVPVGGMESIQVIGGNGTIDVKGIPELEEISIRGVKRVRSESRLDAEKHLAYLDVPLEAGSRKLTVRTVHPSPTGGRSYLVDYEILVPRWFQVSVENGNGTVLVDEIAGDVDVKNGNGHVLFGKLTGSSWVDLGNGRVEAKVVLPRNGVLSYAVGNGGVGLTLDPSVSASFKAKVGNGFIALTGLSLSQAVSSPRSLQGILASGEGVIDLRVGNGSIEVTGG